MYQYVIKRVLLVIPTLFGAAALVFVLMRLIPGDICVVRLGSGGGSFDPQGDRAVPCRARHRPAGDHPVPRLRLGILAVRLRQLDVVGQAGRRLEILTRLPISLEIAMLATVIAILIAIPLGTISAFKQNTWIDYVVRAFAIGGIATPSFWLGIMSILVVLDFTSAVFGTPWMPPIDYVPIWQDPIRNLSMASCRRSRSATATPRSACA